MQKAEEKYLKISEKRKKAKLNESRKNGSQLKKTKQV